MTKKEINEMYMDAIDRWGIEAQVKMSIEEASEFIQALCKMMRGVNWKRYKNLCEEIADLEITMGQIREIYNVDEDLVNEYKEEKLNRLKKKLNM